MPTLLVSTWETGLFSITGKTVRHELAGQSVRGLIDDGQGGVLAIVGAHTLCRRSSAGEWTELARSEAELYGCVTLGEAIFVGTNDARVLRFDPDGTEHNLTGFEQVAGREKWYPGGMLVDGQWMGPPLGVRSMGCTLRIARQSPLAGTTCLSRPLLIPSPSKGRSIDGRSRGAVG